MLCPTCKKEIAQNNINIQTDIAHCSGCNKTFKISETVFEAANDGFEITKPPKGCWYNREGNTVTLGASTRSPIAFFLIPFMVVWSGGALGGIYGTQIYKGEFSPMMSLFGIPFLIGSILFWSLALMAVNGKVEMVLNKQGGTVFTGLGKIGITRKFSWDEISSVNEKPINYRYPGSHGSGIMLEGKKRITIGQSLNDSKRYYLLRALKNTLFKVKNTNTIY